jgi:hypothetical protein
MKPHDENKDDSVRKKQPRQRRNNYSILNLIFSHKTFYYFQTFYY